MNARITRTLAYGLTAALILLWTSAVWAHAFPVRQTPAAGAELATAPKEIRIEFDDALEPAFSSLTVTDSTGRQVGTVKSQVLSSDAKVMVLAIPVLPPGTYRVKWIAVAHDGHRTQGGYMFRVK